MNTNWIEQLIHELAKKKVKSLSKRASRVCAWYARVYHERAVNVWNSGKNK